MSIGNSIDIYRAAGELYYHLRQYLVDGELTMGAPVDGPVIFDWKVVSPAGCVVRVRHTVSPLAIKNVIPYGVEAGGTMVKSIGEEMRETRETEGYKASW